MRFAYSSSSRSTSRIAICSVKVEPAGSSAEMTPRKSGPLLSSTEFAFLEPPGDCQLVVLEQAAKIVLQNRTADRNSHCERERAVAVLVVDRDRSELALAERHVRRFGGPRIRSDLKRRRAKRTAQELPEFHDLGFVHDLSPAREPRAEALPRRGAALQDREPTASAYFNVFFSPFRGEGARVARQLYASSAFSARIWFMSRAGSAQPASPTMRAGTPATVLLCGTGWSTTEPAATRAQ